SGLVAGRQVWALLLNRLLGLHAGAVLGGGGAVGALGLPLGPRRLPAVLRLPGRDILAAPRLAGADAQWCPGLGVGRRDALAFFVGRLASGPLRLRRGTVERPVPGLACLLARRADVG